MKIKYSSRSLLENVRRIWENESYRRLNVFILFSRKDDIYISKSKISRRFDFDALFLVLFLFLNIFSISPITLFLNSISLVLIITTVFMYPRCGIIQSNLERTNGYVLELQALLSALSSLALGELHAQQNASILPHDRIPLRYVHTRRLALGGEVFALHCVLLTFLQDLFPWHTIDLGQLKTRLIFCIGNFLNLIGYKCFSGLLQD